MKNDPAMFTWFLVTLLFLTTSYSSYAHDEDEGDNSPVQVEINPFISKSKKVIQFKRDTRFKRGNEPNAKKPSLFLEFPESFFSDPKLMKLYSSLTGGADSNSNEPQITKLAFQIDPSRIGDATKRKKRKTHSDSTNVMSRSRRQRLANHFAQSVDSKFRSWSDKIDAEIAQANSGISRPVMDRHHIRHESPHARARAGMQPCAPSCPSTCSTTCKTTTCPTTCKTTTCPTTSKTTTTCPTTCSTTCSTTSKTTTCPTTCKTTTTCPTTCSTTTTCPTPSTSTTTCSTTRKITGCPRKNKPEESAKYFFGRFGHKSNTPNIRKKRRFVRVKKNHRIASRMRKRSVKSASNRDHE